jgi:hypothetical protein
MATKDAQDKLRKSFDTTPTDLRRREAEIAGRIANPIAPSTVDRSLSITEQTEINRAKKQVVEVETKTGGIDVFKNIPVSSDSGTTKPLKIFDSQKSQTLQDILFINVADSETATIFLILSELDIDTYSGSYTNQVLFDHPTTVSLLYNYTLRAASTLVSDQATSNQTSLRHAAFLGDLNLISSGKRFFIYIYKRAADGTLNVTVIK